LDGESSTRKASMVTKRCDTTTTLVNQKLEIKQGAATTWEAGQDLVPSALLLVAMCKLDVNVLEGD
jgi:hypothetical protein